MAIALLDRLTHECDTWVLRITRSFAGRRAGMPSLALVRRPVRGEAPVSMSLVTRVLREEDGEHRSRDPALTNARCSLYEP